MKDSFGLHGHYAFGSVAKEESGVGGMDATCGGHITDLVYWLQAGHAPIRNRLSIEERPGIVNLKQRFGDWEMDTIIGGNGKGAVVTLAERTTAFALSEKPPRGRNARELTETVYRMLPPYKDSVHTITVDNGAEFADHQRLARLLDSKIYFTHPYSSREKGLIEYTNKLFRQYIQKKQT